MPDVIENPVINSPYEEPRRHFVFDNEGITNRIAEGCRASTFFIPVAPSTWNEAQLQLEGETLRRLPGRVSTLMLSVGSGIRNVAPPPEVRSDRRGDTRERYKVGHMLAEPRVGYARRSNRCANPSATLSALIHSERRYPGRS